MKRSPLKRGTSKLARTPLHRQSRINPVNRKRKAAKRAERYGPQAAYCRTAPCIACGVCDESEVHHWPTVARGGVDADTVPLCSICHTAGGNPEAFHSTPLEDWQRHHGIDIEAEKRRIRREVAGLGDVGPEWGSPY